MTAPRVALYARVSTADQGQNPEVQLSELRQVAAQRGWRVVEEYVDHGVSGADTSRPALDRMLAACKAGKINIVAVWKLDRLGRSLVHIVSLIDDFTAQGVQFVSLRDAGLDSTATSGSRLMLQLLGAFAEYERTLIKERTIAGVRKAQADGIHCGRPVVAVDLRPAVAMLKAGHGLKAISTSLKVSRPTLRRRLTEAGYWPRAGVDTSPAREGGD